MRAIVQDSYGPIENLRLAEVDQPQVAEDEVLVRVRAASVHADVWHVVTGYPFILRLMGAGIRKPKNPIPGTDMAGVVERVGTNVRDIEPGDEVFGETRLGTQWVNGGAYADYVAVPASILARKPANITFEQAASVPTSGMIALHNLRSVGLPVPGKKVLVNGAGGGVGTIALQLAKAFGAEVTAVDAAEKREMLLSLGADHVIDYRTTDFTQGVTSYDLVYDVASNLRFADCERVLTPTGKYLVIGHDHYGSQGRRIFGSVPKMFTLMARSPFTDRLPDVNTASMDQEELMAALRQFLETGQITPRIDRRYPLERASDALRYLTEGRALGRIVLTP